MYEDMLYGYLVIATIMVQPDPSNSSGHKRRRVLDVACRAISKPAGVGCKRRLL